MVGGEIQYYEYLGTEAKIHNHTGFEEMTGEWDDDDDWEENYGDVRHHKNDSILIIVLLIPYGIQVAAILTGSWFVVRGS